MHAYLLIGTSEENLNLGINGLTKKLNAKIMEYPLQKIDDVRNLNDLIRLSFSEPTLIVCKNIEGAGEEALNAFLKNLEEPQENIYFALTAPSTRKVLPTIVSRCEIVRTINNSQFTIYNEDTEKFVKAKTGERLALIDKIKDRAKAIEFAENILMFLHNKLHSDSSDYQKGAKNIEVVSQTLKNLRANGNVSLQLTNLVISLV
jgi:DNA polymerase III delta prime subunit